MIRAYLKGEQRNWDLNLVCLAAVYRSTPCKTTGFTPNVLLMGREVRKPLEIDVSSTPNSPIFTYCDYVMLLKDKLKKAHLLAQKHLPTSTKRQKNVYDGIAVMHQYKSGDLVQYMYVAENRSVGSCPKLHMFYRGPCVMLQKNSDLNFLIKVDKHSTPKVVHHDKIKRYDGHSCFVSGWISWDMEDEGL